MYLIFLKLKVTSNYEKQTIILALVLQNNVLANILLDRIMYNYYVAYSY